MPDVALRGIPEELHLELKAAAKRSHRSLNGEILARLAASVRPGRSMLARSWSESGVDMRRWGPST